MRGNRRKREKLVNQAGEIGHARVIPSALSGGMGTIMLTNKSNRTQIPDQVTL
jgi:hypothetical protein